jgi:hypothetical protein
MISLSALRKSSVALMILTFVVAACGGGTPTVAPSTATGTQAAPSTAASAPPSSQSVVTLPPGTAAPPASGGAAVDPADDLKIAAPYTLAPLDEQIAAIFVQAMQGSLTGPMANVVQFGFRTAEKDGATQAWVIDMAFPGIPIGGGAMLDQIANAATQGGGTVEDLKVGGKDARLIEQGGQAFVMLIVGDELLMIVGQVKKATVDTAKALAEAN